MSSSPVQYLLQDVRQGAILHKKGSKVVVISSEFDGKVMIKVPGYIGGFSVSKEAVGQIDNLTKV